MLKFLTLEKIMFIKLQCSLVNLLPKRVVMEDLNISGMMKNRHLSKAIQEQCFYEFIRHLSAFSKSSTRKVHDDLSEHLVRVVGIALCLVYHSYAVDDFRVLVVEFHVSLIIAER